MRRSKHTTEDGFVNHHKRITHYLFCKNENCIESQRCPPPSLKPDFNIKKWKLCSFFFRIKLHGTDCFSAAFCLFMFYLIKISQNRFQICCTSFSKISRQKSIIRYQCNIY